MRAGIDPQRAIRSRRTSVIVVATLLTGVLAASCGHSSGTPTSSASTATGSPPTAASSHSTAARVAVPGALAFARCMRANGVPNFPDPSPGGGFAFRSSGATGTPAFKQAQAKCRALLPDGGLPGPGSTTHPSAQTLTKLVRIARCMRAHGISQFPDPRTTVPPNLTGITEITDFDDAVLLFPSTLNMQAPAYRQALTACGAPPLGLHH